MPDVDDVRIDRWALPAELRKRPDADRIQGQKVLSGRWGAITDPYWDNCVIAVPYRHIDGSDDQDWMRPHA
jgi:hypothetical protein